MNAVLNNMSTLFMVNLFLKFLILFVFILPFKVSSQNENFKRFIDSADVYIENNYKLAEQFLDSIPYPVEKNIKGELADYYYLKGLISDDRRNQSKLIQEFILASNYAVKEKKYELAGTLNSELFTNIYFINKDSTAYKYLEKAKYYFKLANYSAGILEVKQMPAYVEYVNKNYKLSNKLLLQDLSEYEKFHEDQYYYMFANYLLVSNYLDIDELDSANLYFKNFISLKQDSTILERDFSNLKTGVDQLKVQYFLRKKNVDSTIYYIQKVREKKAILNYVNTQEYYQQNSDYYKLINDNKYSLMYLDSLIQFENLILKNNIEASIKINDVIDSGNSQLINVTKNGNISKWLVFLLLILVALIFIGFRKKNKFKLKEINNKSEQNTYLNDNNEKLKIKLSNLENFIFDLKGDLKIISSKFDAKGQNEKVRDLYKKVHFDSPISIENQQDYIKLVNELNADFFLKIKKEHSGLIDSEIIICYFLKIGFKNKEIAQFLKTSVRAIESKRYRIGKKILQDNENNISLVQYLKSVYSN